MRHKTRETKRSRKTNVGGFETRTHCCKLHRFSYCQTSLPISDVSFQHILSSVIYFQNKIKPHCNIVFHACRLHSDTQVTRLFELEFEIALQVAPVWCWKTGLCWRSSCEESTIFNHVSNCTELHV